MATGYIFNGFEDITLTYAGVPFFLPRSQVTPIPDYTFREVDHRETAGGDEVGEITYRSLVVPGARIAEELCNRPQSIGQERGIRMIAGEATGKTVTVHGGVPEGAVGPNYARPGMPHTAVECPIDGTLCCQLHVDVPERKATNREAGECYSAAKQWKLEQVQKYLQSKRERMSGGNGRLIPDPTIRRFMEEFQVDDLDDVTAHQQKSSGDMERLTEALTKALQTVSDKSRPLPRGRHANRAPKLKEEEEREREEAVQEA